MCSVMLLVGRDLQRALGVEARHDDDAAAVVQERRGQAVEPAGVEHRHEVERRVARGQLDRQVRRQRVEDELAVRHQHALGAAGRARAVHEDHRILEVDLDRRRRACRRRRRGAARRSGRRPTARRRPRGAPPARRCRRRARRRRGRRAAPAARASATMPSSSAAARRQLSGAKMRAQLGAGEERLEVLAAVVREHGDAVALADAERAGERAAPGGWRGDRGASSSSAAP